ncbi:MAG: lipase family protein [Candidatus Omnitrophica bacterium]|nr:lipase family protein [Candidatus Omnitrophota bacterium]
MAKFEFNPKTKRYDAKNALLLAEASQLAYAPLREVKEHVKNEWGFDNCIFLDKNDTQAYIIANTEVIILAFRGTQCIQDWLTDADARFVKNVWGQVHNGFSKALDSVWREIEKIVSKYQDNDQTIWITGHSLGAALAVLATARFLQKNIDINGLYTFGQPRVGNATFARIFNLRFKHRTFRFVNNEDIVTRVPPTALKYEHIGNVFYFDTAGKLHRGIQWWRMFMDCSLSQIVRATVRYKDLSEEFPDGIEDHDIARYIARIKKNNA